MDDVADEGCQSQPPNQLRTKSQIIIFHNPKKTLKFSGHGIPIGTEATVPPKKSMI